MPKIDFHITAEHLDTGLRGFPVGTCWTSKVDPEIGVSYVGYPIDQLAYMEPESIIYLVFNKNLPTPEQAAAFKADLARRATVDPVVLDLIRGLPRQGHPMEWFTVAIQYLGMTSETKNYHEDALDLVARIPEMLAAIFRVREGWGEPIASDPSLGYVENFVHMLGVPNVDPAKITRLLRIYYILHMDHGGGNLSTFVGKSVASGLADVFQSMASAMNGLAGPRHGLANQDCFSMVKEIDTADVAEAERKIRTRLESGGLIFGFGHAVLRQEDPRAKVQIAVGEEICPDDHYFKVVKAVREAGIKVLKENPKVSNPYPNVDLISGTLLNAMGMSNPDYFTTLFGWSRIAGIGAQIVDERQHFRGGKGVAIYRPRYVGINQLDRSV